MKCIKYSMFKMFRLMFLVHLKVSRKSVLQKHVLLYNKLRIRVFIVYILFFCFLASIATEIIIMNAMRTKTIMQKGIKKISKFDLPYCK